MNTHRTPPAATVPSRNMRRVCVGIGRSGLAALLFAGAFRRVEGGGEPLLLAEIARPLPEPRPADAGRAVTADQLALRVLTLQFEDEQVLGDDDVAFHPHYFG